PGGEEPTDVAAHRRGPRLFEGPMLRKNAGGGLPHHLRPQDRRAQGHRRSVHRSPGPESKAAAGRRRAGGRPPGRHRSHGPDRGLCQGCGAAAGKFGGETPLHGENPGLCRRAAVCHPRLENPLRSRRRAPYPLHLSRGLAQ
ncbi:Zinc-ribbon domain-containing protein, partial [Dysosmobacter welbionis]